VDAISAFGADNIDMQEHFIDVLILSSNKALGLQPGLSMLVLSPRAIELLPIQPLSYYFNISSMLNDGQRGQTPFTPAVNILLQLQLRLAKWIKLGMSTVLARTAQNANHFRRAIVGLPLKFYSSSMSNALTAIEVTNSISAISVVERLESEHGTVVAPNGGSLAERVFRISHLGNVGIKEMDYAASALGTVLMEN
jgi:aspartate aminotransferase-like enzyme